MNGQNDTSDKDSEQDSIFNLLFQINVAGLGVSICVFVIELALKFRSSPVFRCILSLRGFHTWFRSFVVSFK